MTTPADEFNDAADPGAISSSTQSLWPTALEALDRIAASIRPADGERGQSRD